VDLNFAKLICPSGRVENKNEGEVKGEGRGLKIKNELGDISKYREQK